MVEPLRLAIIGPGKIADRSLAPAIAKVPGAVLHSVMSRDAGRARDFAARHGATAKEPCHTDLGSLLADPDLDAVILASPDRLHGPQALRAAQAKKSILCEKPLVTDRREGRLLLEAVERHGVRLGVAYHLRFHAGHRAMIERIRAGAVGRIEHVVARWTFKAPDASNWRADREVGRWWGLAGVGTHCLDMVRWVMLPEAGEVSRIESLITRQRWQSPHDETAMVALQFASGATAEITTSVLFDSVPRFEVHGSEGSVICEGTFGPHGRGEIRIKGVPLEFEAVDPYVGEIADFVAAVREGREPEVGGAEGLRNVEILSEAAPEA